MAAPEPIVPSRRLQNAAAAERERLVRELERLDRRLVELQRTVDRLEAIRAELRDQLVLLARLTSSEESPFPAREKRTHLRAVEQDAAPQGVLSGARVREVAVLLLASSPNPRRPIHYQQWYALLRSAGYGIEAQDPAAAFLTQVRRSPVVKHANAPGVYALDFTAPAALRESLRKLEGQLERTSMSRLSADDVSASRVRRAKLANATRACERRLEEALRSLGTEPLASHHQEGEEQHEHSEVLD